MTPAPLPIPEFMGLGEKLQQAIELTTARVSKMPPGRMRAKASRTLTQANKLFAQLSQMAQMTAGFTGFLSKAIGVSVDDLFRLTGKPKIARGVAYVGVEAVNKMVGDMLDSLHAINVEIDKEVKHGEKDNSNQQSA